MMRSKLQNKLTSELLGQSGHALPFSELQIRAKNGHGNSIQSSREELPTQLENYRL